MDPNDWNLDAALARLSQGERSEFDRVFRHLWPILKSFAQKQLQDDQDAQDAAQRALETLLSRVSDYDSTRSGLGWAIALTAWECRTVKKRRERARRRETDPLRPGIEAHHDEPASPEAEVILKSILLTATEAAGKLSALDQATLRAALFDDTEHKREVGVVTFRKRYQRAAARLRYQWRKLYGY